MEAYTFFFQCLDHPLVLTILAEEPVDKDHFMLKLSCKNLTHELSFIMSVKSHKITGM
jgi:hypothetical protein